METEPHTWDDGTVTTAATCTETGMGTYTCAACGEVKTETIPASGHAYGPWTSLNEAEHRRICGNDSGHVETEPHTWDAGTVTKAATCTDAGVRTYTCSVCGGVKTETIPASGHAYGPWEPYTATQHRRVCGNDSSHVETELHTWNAGTVTTAATCTKAGVRTYTCSVCGGVKTERIPASGHAYGPWEPYTATQHRRVCGNDSSHVETEPHTWDEGTVTTAATCTETGVRTYTCTVCGGAKTETIDPMGHTSPDENGNCARCQTHLKDIVDPNACPYCGQTHGGLFGWLVSLIHTLLFRLFGKK